MRSGQGRWQRSLDNLTSIGEIVIEFRLYELQKQDLSETLQALRAFLGLEPQEKDIACIVSVRANIWWTSPEQKKEVVAELIMLNLHCQLADLKMLVRDYSS